MGNRYFHCISDCWLGGTEGFSAVLAEPGAIADALYNSPEERSELLSKYHELAEFADSHYLESPYHIETYDIFDRAYVVGAIVGLVMVVGTLGLAHMGGKVADGLATRMARKNTRIK